MNVYLSHAAQSIHSHTFAVTLTHIYTIIKENNNNNNFAYTKNVETII